MTMDESNLYYSPTHRVEIENRGGVGFGKVYIYRANGDTEAIMLWSMSSGIMDSGNIVTDTFQRQRAILAMEECRFGREMLSKVYGFDFTQEDRHPSVSFT